PERSNRDARSVAPTFPGSPSVVRQVGAALSAPRFQYQCRSGALAPRSDVLEDAQGMRDTGAIVVDAAEHQRATERQAGERIARQPMRGDDVGVGRGGEALVDEHA